jgi:hypothetical protein
MIPKLTPSDITIRDFHKKFKSIPNRLIYAETQIRLSAVFEVYCAGPLTGRQHIRRVSGRGNAASSTGADLISSRTCYLFMLRWSAAATNSQYNAANFDTVEKLVLSRCRGVIELCRVENEKSEGRSVSVSNLRSPRSQLAPAGTAHRRLIS